MVPLSLASEKRRGVSSMMGSKANTRPLWKERERGEQVLSDQKSDSQGGVAATPPQLRPDSLSPCRQTIQFLDSDPELWLETGLGG